MPSFSRVGTTSFSRMGEPFIMTVSATSANTQNAITVPSGATSFYVVNRSPFYIRLRGSSPTAEGNFIPVTSTTGWCFPPGHFGIYATRDPKWISVLGIEDQSFPLGSLTGTVEIGYGVGF